MMHLKYCETHLDPYQKTVAVSPWLPAGSSGGISIRSGLIPSLSKDFIILPSDISVF